jgi:hypothetical protein
MREIKMSKSNTAVRCINYDEYQSLLEQMIETGRCKILLGKNDTGSRREHCIYREYYCEGFEALKARFKSHNGIEYFTASNRVPNKFKQELIANAKVAKFAF